MVDAEQPQTCEQIVHSSKYEKQGTEAFNWWCRLFELMEKEYQIKPHQRQDVIEKIFPKEIFEKIVSLLITVKETSKRFLSRIDKGKGPEKDVSKTTLTETQIDHSEKEAKIVSADQLRTDVSQVPPLKIRRREAGPNNPYLKFFKTNPDRAAIWRDLPPLSLEEMNLKQKAEAVTEAIAIDFINWMIKLGGETKTTLDVPQVVKMFEIGFNTHAATSLVGIVKELPAVTGAVSRYRQLPAKSIRARLHHTIGYDSSLLMKESHTIAFGTSLPGNLKWVPPRPDDIEKWKKVEYSYDHLTSMEAVWKGITDIRSTRAFCKWLIDHPEHPAPKYLEECGMLDPDYYDRPHYSIDSQDIINDEIQ